jgi:hypothetical protein
LPPWIISSFAHQAATLKWSFLKGNAMNLGVTLEPWTVQLHNVR